MIDPHENHGNVVLSLTVDTPDGGSVHQSWSICDCTLPALRARLGPPHQETVASAEAKMETALHVLNQAGLVHDLRSDNG